MENLFTKDCIRSFSGKYVNIFEPTSDMFVIEDIAHALSMIPRFTGHTKYHYSVALHSLECGREMAEDEHSSLRDIRSALMHDASEAYLTDVASPIKVHLDQYYKIEDRLMKILAEKFRFDWPKTPKVDDIDKRLLVDEWQRFMLKGEKPDYTIEQAEQYFLDVFEECNK